MRRVEGDFTVWASPQKVLDYCGDLRNVFPAIPGVHEVKEGSSEKGVLLINIGVSFIRGRFTVRIERTERTDSGMRFRGHGDGVGNAVDFESSLEVAPSGAAATNVHWASDVSVHGPLASMAAGLMNPVINQNVDLFVGNLKKGLEGQSTPLANTPAPAADNQHPSFKQRMLAALPRLFRGGKTKQNY
jgi:carbon monoxide dehydrogenase subunit G